MAEISNGSLAQVFASFLRNKWNAVLAVQSGDSSSQLAVAAISVLALLVVWQLLAIVDGLQRRRLPPGPRPWPIVGNFPSIASALPHRALQNLSAKYGGLMFLRMGTEIYSFSFQVVIDVAIILFHNVIVNATRLGDVHIKKASNFVLNVLN